MNPVTIRLKPLPGGTTISLEIVEDDRPIGHANLEAPELDALIAALAVGRAGLAEQVPTELDDNARLKTVHEPFCRIGVLPDGSEKLLSIRHPGLGWLAFSFDAERAKLVGEELAQFQG